MTTQNLLKEIRARLEAVGAPRAGDDHALFDLSTLLAIVDVMQAALEKIEDPRKRDHKEPDAYTTLGCVMSIASEALQACDKLAGGE